MRVGIHVGRVFREKREGAEMVVKLVRNEKNHGVTHEAGWGGLAGDILFSP